MNFIIFTIFSLGISTFNNTEEFLFIGHAYGSTFEKDHQIDPKLLSFFYQGGLENYKYIIWGGDFIEDCNNEVEIYNFNNLLPKSVLEKSIYVIGNHESACYGLDKLSFIKKDENRLLRHSSHDIFFLNTNFKNYKEADSLSIIINSSKRDKLIFTHQVIFSKTDWLFRTNSRENYAIANYFYDRINKDKNRINFIAGDVGAYTKMPFLTFFKNRNNNFITSGIGNKKNNYVLAIRIENGEVTYNKINLDNHNKTNLNSSSIITYQIKNFFQYTFLSQKRTFVFILLFIMLILFKVNFVSRVKRR